MACVIYLNKKNSLPINEDVELIWSQFLRGIVMGTIVEMPKEQFPVSKYLLRSLKEVVKVGKFREKEIVESHKKYILKNFDLNGYYQRYLAQCDEILTLIRESNSN